MKPSDLSGSSSLCVERFIRLFFDALTYSNTLDFRQPIVTALLYIHAVLLLPLFHSLWLDQGTGNANFFYASTLVFGMANGAGLLDAIWAGLACAIPVSEKWDVSQE